MSLNRQTQLLIPIILMCLLLISAGCGQTPQATLPPVSSTPLQAKTETPPVDGTAVPFTQTTAPTFTTTPVPTPAEASAPLTQYQMEVQFDYVKGVVDVKEHIVLFNRWSDALSSLVLVVEPNHTPGVFTLNSLLLDGSPLPADSGFSLEGHTLTVPLAVPLAPEQSLTLDLDFHLDLPPIQPTSSTEAPTPFGYSDNQTNLVSWYPYLAAYDPSSGWLVHERTLYGEHEVYDVADFTIDLSLVNPPKNLKIAASAPAEPQGEVLHYSLRNARTFAISASESYIVKSQVVGNTTITAYSFPWDQAASEAALNDTAKALQLFSNLFGSYDRPSLSVVEAAFLDGMEYDGLFFLSYGFYNIWDGTPSSYLTAIAAHETAHQWWFGKVGSDQAMEPWLDESMATFSEELFYENFYPLSINWWRDGRINEFLPAGFINKPVKDYVSYESYRSAVYLNGAMFFDELRSTVGKDAFFSFLRDYADRYAYQRATERDFFAVLRQHTSVDLNPLIEKYFDPAFLQ
jgi:hypothetical protein